MTALNHFPISGYALINGNHLNKVVDAVNNVTGNGTPAAVTSAALTSTGNVDLQGAVFALDNIETAITAHAGGGQTSAYQLSKVISVLATVATAANSVKLPAPTAVGQVAVIINNTATSAQVFGSGTDTINGVATATGVAQAGTKTPGLYIATTIGAAAAWFRILSA